MNTYGLTQFQLFDYNSPTESQRCEEFTYKTNFYPELSPDLTPELNNDFLYNLNNDANTTKEVQVTTVVNTVPSNVYQPQFLNTDTLDQQFVPTSYPQLINYDYNPTLTYFYQDYRNNTLTRGLPRGRAVLDEHPSIRPFRCDFPKCGKMFKRSEHLKRHSRSIHSFYRPHLCDFPGCHKSFSRTDNLAQHKRIHQTKNQHQPSLSVSTTPITQEFPKFEDSNIISPLLSPLHYMPHLGCHQVLNHNITAPFTNN